MFKRLSAFVVNPDCIARGLNEDYGIVNNNQENSQYLEGYDVLNSLVAEQEYGSSCYVPVFISIPDLNDAVEMYNRALDEGWDNIDCYAIRMRALNWLRNHVPLNEDIVLLEVEY